MTDGFDRESLECFLGGMAESLHAKELDLKRQEKRLFTGGFLGLSFIGIAQLAVSERYRELISAGGFIATYAWGILGISYSERLDSLQRLIGQLPPSVNLPPKA